MRNWIVVFCVLLSAPVFGAVGNNNFTINVGGSFNASFMSKGLANIGSTNNIEASGFYGGGYNVELGYLAMNNGRIVHAFDLRVGFGMNYNQGSTIGIGDQNFDIQINSQFNSLHAYIGTTYAMGAMIGKGRLLVDILGFNFGYFTADEVINYENDEDLVIKGGNNFLFSLNLPLGLHYIFDSGFMFGFRHRLDIAYSAAAMGGSGLILERNGRFGFDSGKTSYIAYSLTVSLGFAIGKPFETK